MKSAARSKPPQEKISGIGRPFGVLAIRAAHSGRVSLAQVRRLSGRDAGAPPARDRANNDDDDDSGFIRGTRIEGGRLGMSPKKTHMTDRRVKGHERVAVVASSFVRLL
ncbi:hypothetical protein ISCGN_028791 [Ixodes scapularis]